MSPTEDLPTGQIRFLENYRPGLEDGAYEVTVAQTLSAQGATVDPLTRRFVVSGPRFALNPRDVHAQYPPAAASGHFAEVLPHVVFAKRLLPWERLLPTGELSTPPDPRTPWLALLTFGPGELLVADGADPTQAAIAGYAATATVAKLLGEGSADVRVPHVTADTADEAALSCQVILIASETFANVVPTRRELAFLAHGRQVDVAGKALLDMQNAGEFAVLVANRFPLPGTATVGERCIAHVVSLEGFGDLLGGAAPVRPRERTVKLVSLYSWTFACLQEPAQTFRGLARNLAFDGETPRPPASLMLSVPCTPSAATDAANVAATTRLRDGYVALGYHARTGEDGFAWYRGPLTPSVANPQHAPGSFHTSDAAMIFDSATGVFDLGLAVAWQCGRSLALADQAYAEALMRLRRRVRDRIHQHTVGGADLSGASGGTDPPSGIGNAHATLAGLIGGGALDHIAESSTGAELPRVAQTAPAPTPSPAPVQRLRALLASPAVRESVQDPLAEDSDAIAIATWLGRLALLQGVPFNHLVPDARMLPAESLRFFYLDRDWISALLDGALAIGLGTSEESSVQDVLSAKLHQLALESALAARASALGQSPPPAPAGPSSGFLLRSALTRGWPGVTVSGRRAGAEVQLLRMDAVQPDLLFVIFAGVPDTVTLEEPHEGLAFGVEEAGVVVVRTLQGATVASGAEVAIYDPDAPQTPRVSLRPGGLRVLNVNSDPAFPTRERPTAPVDLLGAIARALGEGTAALTPAALALQLVRGPELLTFASALPPTPAGALGTLPASAGTGEDDR
jgi:hypothetical protein